MRYADAKDLKRAQDLGKHSGASKYTSPTEIARGKSSSMAAAITDKRKILGRLEAVASIWDDYVIMSNFIDRCIMLWPDSQYSEAFNAGYKQGTYLKREMRNLSIPKDFLLKKYLINNETGNFINGQSYKFDEVARIIFNTMLKRQILW